MDFQSLKTKFGIVGRSKKLDLALSVATKVAPTDLSVIIFGESGVGKENFPKIIHQLSNRKHNPYVAVNCGAIPEGTIDSELFGHEKGSFTGAVEKRKGYFEEANGGTIFLDEVADLPLSTQVRLLRVLETGEYLKVGSSKLLFTDVRIIAATNIDLQAKIGKEKFREDLYYRLNTVPIQIPALRERKEDIELLFKKFVGDFSKKYQTPPISLDNSALDLLKNYTWPGNVRQLKNVAEQVSILEENRLISDETLKKYIDIDFTKPIKRVDAELNLTENEQYFFKMLFDLKGDVVDIKKLLFDLYKVEKGHVSENQGKLFLPHPMPNHIKDYEDVKKSDKAKNFELLENEKQLIKTALKKFRGKRKEVAQALGVSERTLYRKIKEFDISEI